jgi:hypothetical protein
VRLGDRSYSWREIAELTGAVAHPLMQWDSVARSLRPSSRPETRGWQFSDPPTGSMPLDLLARIAGIIAAAGPTECRAGLWDGNGALYPESSSVITLTAFAPGHAAERPAAKPEEAMFDPAEWESRKLELPGRAHFVFEVDLRRLCDPVWAEDSGWGPVASVWHDTPNLLWPVDRSWFLASEIDFDSTLIGCSTAVAAALLADETLEAALIPEDASLTFDSDTING